jgi:hypothetical protein
MLAEKGQLLLSFSAIYTYLIPLSAMMTSILAWYVCATVCDLRPVSAPTTTRIPTETGDPAWAVRK